MLTIVLGKMYELASFALGHVQAFPLKHLCQVAIGNQGASYMNVDFAMAQIFCEALWTDCCGAIVPYWLHFCHFFHFLCQI